MSESKCQQTMRNIECAEVFSGLSTSRYHVAENIFMPKQTSEKFWCDMSSLKIPLLFGLVVFGPTIIKGKTHCNVTLFSKAKIGNPCSGAQSSITILMLSLIKSITRLCILSKYTLRPRLH